MSIELRSSDVMYTEHTKCPPPVFMNSLYISLELLTATRGISKCNDWHNDKM